MDENTKDQSLNLRVHLDIDEHLTFGKLRKFVEATSKTPDELPVLLDCDEEYPNSVNGICGYLD